MTACVRWTEVVMACVLVRVSVALFITRACTPLGNLRGHEIVMACVIFESQGLSSLELVPFLEPQKPLK